MSGSAKSVTIRMARCASVALSLALQVAAQKFPDVRIDRGAAGAAGSQSPQVVAEGASVYVTWLDYRNGEADVYFSRSPNGGASWLPNDLRLDTDPPGAAYSYEPQIAVSGGLVFVTWVDGRSNAGDIYFNRSLNGGRTWLPADLRLDTDPPGAAGSSHARIAASGSSVYVTWEDARGGPLGNFHADVRFNRSLDGGATWLPNDLQVNSGPAGVTRSLGPQIASSGSSVYVVWYEDRNALYVPGARFDVFFNRSLDGGGTWLGPDVRLDTDPTGSANSLQPAIAASGAAVYAVWSDERNGGSFGGDVYFNRSLDGGITWLLPDVRLDTDPPGASHSEHQQIAASGAAVYVVWTDHRNGKGDIYFNRSLDHGSTWLSRDVRIDTDPAGSGHSWFPRIAADGAQVTVTWYDQRNPGPLSGDVYCNRSTDGGATWLAADVRLDVGDPPGASNSLAPAIAASGPAVYVAWEDDRTSKMGRSDIYFNIPFGAQAYGGATRGAGGIAPALAVAGSVTLGSTVSCEVSNGLGSATGAVLVGAGPASKVALSVLGGTLLVWPVVALPLVLGGPSVPGGGSGSLSLAIPPAPAAFGVNVNCQALFLDPGAAFLVSMTNGVELWIG